jgi:hypothetical protein
MPQVLPLAVGSEGCRTASHRSSKNHTNAAIPTQPLPQAFTLFSSFPTSFRVVFISLSRVSSVNYLICSPINIALLQFRLIHTLNCNQLLFDRESTDISTQLWTAWKLEIRPIEAKSASMPSYSFATSCCAPGQLHATACATWRMSTTTITVSIIHGCAQSHRRKT